MKLTNKDLLKRQQTPSALKVSKVPPSYVKDKSRSGSNRLDTRTPAMKKEAPVKPKPKQLVPSGTPTSIK